MGAAGEPRTDRWAERPVLGATLQGLLTITPLMAGIGVGLALSRAVLPGRVDGRAATWTIAGLAAMVTVWLLQRLMRRIVPLAWLLKLGMLWPGQAPSRFKVARRAGRIRDLEERLRAAREHGLRGDAESAAELILSLTAALTAHDRKTRGHAERVRIFTDLLAMEMRLSRDDRDRLRWSSLLHDIGKLEVPERILNKPGKPSAAEWERLRSHPEAGDRIMAPLKDWLGEWADATLHHHERWDGKGYPKGLAGNQISRAGRIVTVADAYEVMTAARAYKRPMSAAAAREELVKCAGDQFDPAIVRQFLLIPLWRLRWALGPVAWVAQLPLARDAIHAGSSMGAMGPAAGAAAAGTAAGATLILAGPGAGSDGEPRVSSELLLAAFEDPSDIAERDREIGAGDARATDEPASDDTGSDAAIEEIASPEGTRAQGGADGHEGAGEPDAREVGSGERPDDPGSPDGSVSSGSAPSTSGTDGTTGTVEKIVEDTSSTVDKVVGDTTGTVAKVIDDTRTTLDKVTKDLEGTAGKLLDDPVAGATKLVDDTTDTLNKTVNDTAGTLDKTVNDTAGTLDKAVDDTTGTLDKTVRDTTGTVRRLLRR